MIVSELISRLQKLPKDAIVIVDDGPEGRPSVSNWCGIVKDKSIIEQVLHAKKQKIVQIQGSNY